MNEITTHTTPWTPAAHPARSERVAAGVLAVAGAAGLAWCAAMIYVVATWSGAL